MTFDPDPYRAQAVGLVMEVSGRDHVPMHQHIRGQLLTTLWGPVSCETADGLWQIALNSALWIPGGQMHKSTVPSGAQIVIIYFAAHTVHLPSTACFLTLTPLVREMMLHLARLGGDYAAGTRHSRIANLLIEELSEAAIDHLYVAMPADPRLKRIAYAMLEEPGRRRTLAEWAGVALMSERSLRRQIERETGMTFGRWSQQFRLAVALRELRSGVPVKIVADKLGYDSIAAFSTMFKKCMGQPPGRYASAWDPSAKSNDAVRCRGPGHGAGVDPRQVG